MGSPGDRGGEGGFEGSGGATIMAVRLKCATKSAFAEKKTQGRLGWRQGRGVDMAWMVEKQERRRVKW